MTYQDAIYFAETGGLVLLVTLFVVAVFYALWPGNSAKFNRAASAPLRDDDDMPAAPGGKGDRS
ncbi:cbb3-type cytochrome c oxidase subunit 3 [Pseudokordiimonas caeni]|uniref:cbb3-type cytochrome c oxidase subunit 3 n=1 Tax=Pseudokordiimonas caeni TaxID=2997908 RepID=UPI002810FF71|nr:cbb3-type cytochrome c oxidase subunit 3 [Pseudokordiimonas caeni]